ncbi:hypothetical protein [Candidatus Enterovibrio altilux]|uniref:hypothetical protein n=1 Tax=Candidatus Enterovibrio altilux TaxID=1927128 RepID=UPI001237E7AE|nr:hypothetical protein [Candidatus Enterovibrio luxaltus]
MSLMVQYELTCSNRPAEKLIKYQPIMLVTSNNITKPFKLNVRFHASHPKKSNCRGTRSSA